MKTGRRITKDRASGMKSLRPTTGKVREALFNILRDRTDNACFLDLYAGTGAVGIEALKQGASEAVFVEAGGSSYRNIEKLINKFGFSANARIIRKKVLSFIKWAELNHLTFDIIFLDPPYHTDDVINALTAVGISNILKHNGVVIAEHFVKKQLPDEFGRLRKFKEYKYGDSVLSLYKS